MSVLHFQVAGEGVDASGKKVSLKSNQSLRIHGPMVSASIGIAEGLAQSLIEQGAQISPPITGGVLIDTASSQTFVDLETVKKLKAPVIDWLNVFTGEKDTPQFPVYPVRFDLPGLQAGININRAVGVNLKTQGLIAMLGRDFLQHFVMNYDGTTGMITLSI